jgi:undecaprenyl-phosphate galactose phosphotransferase
VAFSKWHFSRYIWAYCWIYAIIMVPVSREITKVLLDKLGYWKKRTVILGAGRNAREAYLPCKAMKSLVSKSMRFAILMQRQI